MPLSIEDVRIFADGLDHPECVAVHQDGSVWAGGEGGQIYKISEDGKVIEEINNTKGFNLGIAFSPGAKWLAVCDNENKCVWKLDIKTTSLQNLQQVQMMFLLIFLITYVLQKMENYL